MLNMSQTIERTTLTQLVTNEQYARKVLPFMKKDYFSDRTERAVFEDIQKFVDKYNDLPNQNALEVELDSRKDLNEGDYKRVISVVKELQKEGLADIKIAIDGYGRTYKFYI